MDNYKCIGTELFATDNNVPVFEANHSEFFEDNPTKNNVTCEEGEEADGEEKLEDALKQLKRLCEELQNGSTIVSIHDDAELSSRRRRLQLQRPDLKTQISFSVEKFQPGPIDKHSSAEDVSETMYLTADSKMVVIKVDKKPTKDGERDVSEVTFSLFYIDLKTRNWGSYQFATPKERLGSHMVALHSTQVFVCFKVPVEVFVVDFHDLQHIGMHHWSADMKASRFLSCLNFVMIYDSQKYPEDLLCVTLAKGKTSELLVKKPSILLGESVESLQVVNINGRVLLLAQQDSTLLFLTLNHQQFMVLNQLDFTKSIVQKHYTPLIIKKILCWKDSLLYIPIARMKSTFSEDDDPLSKDVVIAIVDLHTFQLTSILRIMSKVDIYKEVVSLALLDHGTTLIVKTLKKSGRQSNVKAVTSNHAFKMFPQTLQSATMRVITQSSKNKRCLVSDSTHYPPTKIRKKIIESLDY